MSSVIILQSCYKRSQHPRKPTHHMLLLSFVIILQSCYKRSQHPRKPTHHMSFVIILQSCYKISQHPRKPTHHMLLLIFVIILQSCYKRSQHPRKTSTSHVATIFCNHLAKLLQKIIAPQKNQHITHVASTNCAISRPLLNGFKLVCVSTQIWGMLHISFKSFLVDI